MTTTRVPRSLLLAACLGAVPAALAAQEAAADSGRWRPRRAEVTRFYDAATPVEATLLANFGRLRSDRDTSPAWRWGAITYVKPDGARDSVPVRVRPRGVWRRKHCRMPPLRVDFARATSAGTMFEGVTRPKLVNYCTDDDRGEEYILSEYQLYRAYALLTPRSFRARLALLSYADSGSGKVRSKRYAILTEDADALAARIGGRQTTFTGMTKQELDTAHYALTSVFQFMVGNTDWSVGGLHNIEIVEDTTGRMYPIAYDFDYTGAVNAHYAAPPEMLRIPNVRTRLFRGPCYPVETYERAFSLLRERKDAIYALYRDDVGRLMDDRTVSRTLKYFDDFYEIIGDPKRAKREILDACLKDT